MIRLNFHVFERPDEGLKPLGFLRTLLIVISTHLGVRSRKNRVDDFNRANGLHIFVAGVIYFACIIFGLIMLVRYLAG
ncbi:MAG: DUF2970 domain-containing protein [Pseudomonadales bacterium]